MDVKKLLLIYQNNKIAIDNLESENAKLKMLAVRSYRRCKMFRKMWFVRYSRKLRIRETWTNVKNSSFWETDVKTMSNEKFRNYFRMDRSTFNFIVGSLKNLKKKDTFWRKAIPYEKRIAITLYAIGSTESYKAIANLFGVGRSTVGEIVLEVCSEIWDVFQKEFLNVYHPPLQEKLNEIITGFEILGLPQIFGAINSCHIEISPPANESTDYYNSKGFYSIILFAAVDYRNRFTYINIGCPGKMTNSIIYENSNLKKYHENSIFQRNSRTIEGVSVPVMLIGDSTFQLSENLLKPFPLSTNQTQDEEIFNTNLLKCHQVVEDAFWHLKARFPKIGSKLTVQLDNARVIIKACCILHNLCNERNDRITDSWEDDISRNSWTNESIKIENQQNLNNNMERNSTRAINIRNAFTNYCSSSRLRGLPENPNDPGPIESGDNSWSEVVVSKFLELDE